MSNARVLVVEDDMSIRSGLAWTLRSQGFEVHEAADGLSALEEAAAVDPDIAIVDVGLPEGPDGIAVAVQLRNRHGTAVVFLTSADAVADRLAGFDAGADDYMVKPFDIAELLARVRAVLRRAGRPADHVKVGGLVVSAEGGTVSCDGVAITLTAIERELLAVLARHAGRVLSKSQLLSLVWGYDYLPNVVEVTVSRLRRKLPPGAPALETVRGRGYVLRRP